MFDGLKKKFKGLKKKGGGGEDDTAEFEMGDDALDELEEDIEEYDDDDDTGEINPQFDDANKKKVKMAVVIVVILAVGYVAVDEFVLKNSADVALSTPPIKKRKRPKKKKKKPIKKKIEKVAKKEEAPKKVEPVKTPAPPKVETKIVDTPPPAPAPAEVKPMNDPMDTPPSQNSGELSFNDNDSSSGGDSSSSSSFAAGSGSGSGSGSSDDVASTFEEFNDVKSNTGSSSGAAGSSSGMTDTETPIEYVSPPNYEALGRGLVYNCVKQHWACVNKVNFFQCQENSKWFASKNEASECVTDAVYATLEDCKGGQLQKINSTEVPDQCYEDE